MRTALITFSVVATIGTFAALPASLRAQDTGAAVLDVFQRRCAECHGSNADQTKKSWKRMNTIDDLTKLRQNQGIDGKEYKKKIVDIANPAASRILEKAVGDDADMPRNAADDYVPLPDSEKAAISAWFTAGMPLPGESVSGNAKEKSESRPPFVDEEVWLNAILADLTSLPASDRQEARYFTMGHLYNAGIGEPGLVAQRRGLTKLLNSLSWKSEVAGLHLLGPGNGIARILLRDLDWDAQKWDDILAVEKNYFVHYGIDQESKIETLTNTRVAYVRSDWFVFQAAQPPLYHELLAPRSDPNALASDRALEMYIGVDVDADVRDSRVARSGFYGGQVPGGSGVSDNNRMLERHEIPVSAVFPNGGAYWRSYDFAGSAEEKNIFERPFGPAALPSLSTELTARAFTPDGGELIWNLPNGFQAYLLVNGKGERIDTGPPQIVKDRDESGGLGTIIVNGISCMACHSKGMNSKADMIRAHVEGLTPVSFTRGERQLVQKLFPEVAAMDKLFYQDARRFAEAASKAGVLAIDEKQHEPVLAVFKSFRDDTVKLDQAAFELGLSPQQLREAPGISASIKRQLGNQGIPRDQFLDSFRELARGLRVQLVSEPNVGDAQARSGNINDQRLYLRALLVDSTGERVVYGSVENRTTKETVSDVTLSGNELDIILQCNLEVVRLTDSSVADFDFGVTYRVPLGDIQSVEVCSEPANNKNESVSGDYLCLLLRDGKTGVIERSAATGTKRQEGKDAPAYLASSTERTGVFKVPVAGVDVSEAIKMVVALRASK